MKFAAILIGLIIFPPGNTQVLPSEYLKTSNCQNSKHCNITEAFIKKVNSTIIRETLKFLTKNPHMTGTIHDDALISFIMQTWKQQGLDSVEKVSYESLASFADKENPNKVELLDANASVLFVSKTEEEALRKEDVHEDSIPIYNAFSPNATVEGDLLYAHYAKEQDFEELNRLAINVTGKIIIAKYGKGYRGNKVILAQQHGAIGIILFSDPEEYAQNGTEDDQVYPNSWWLPGSGVQRGSLRRVKGDALTPQYPAIDGVFRLPIESADMPKIPCQPIGYKDALFLLKQLDGENIPNKWSPVPFKNMKIGPGFSKTNKARKVRLTVNNYLKIINVTNIIGIIKGSAESDRYVLAGNHRDAWGFGAIDASSGTAQMLEVTRVYGELLAQGWRPKRTIVFCSWGAEELGIIGSTEWVEDNYIKLTQRAIAYVNTDICVSGDAFYPAANPLLAHFLISVTHDIPSPKNESQSLYKQWKDDSALDLGIYSEDPEVSIPGGGTDHIAFAYFAGVPSIDLTFGIRKGRYRETITSYPGYHSAMDTFYLVDTFMDPEFRYLRACSHVNGLLLQRLADEELLPLNVSHYSHVIVREMDKFKMEPYYALLRNHSATYLDALEEAIHKFNNTTLTWQSDIENSLTQNFSNMDVLCMRCINDQISHLEQAFLLPKGLPLQEQFRHSVFSLSLHDSYGSSVFPGLRDLLHISNTKTKGVHSEEKWTEINKHLSDLIIAFHQAAALLMPLSSI